MTQPDITTTLRRIQREARRNAAPLVTPAEETAWSKYKDYALPIIAALVAALIDNRIAPREFERLMLAQIRQSRLIAYAITRGGLNALTPEDRARIDARVAAQNGFLTAWVASMSSGDTGVESGAANLLIAGKATSLLAQKTRAEMYLEAAGAELWAGKAAAVGLPELPAYPGDGSTRCRIYCHCSWMINQVGDADWDCYWLLGLAEHCEHCPRRALAWSPLMVRNGIIQPYLRAGLFL